MPTRSKTPAPVPLTRHLTAASPAVAALVTAGASRAALPDRGGGLVIEAGARVRHGPGPPFRGGPAALICCSMN